MKKDEDKRGDSSYAEGALSILSILKHDSRQIEEILLLPSAKKDEKNILKLLTLARKKKIPISTVDNDFFDSVVTGHTHGGVIAKVGREKWCP